MKKTLFVCLVLALVASWLLAGVAQAKSEYVQQIPADVQNKSCSLCHTSSIPELNDAGKAWVAAGKDWSVFKPKAEPKPATPAGGATAGGGEGQELPKTGGLPLLFVVPGLAAVGAGLLLRHRKA